MTETMVEFRILNATPMSGERILLRVSQIMCLLPDHRQVRTVERGWTLTAHPADWDKVERAFRSAYLGGKVHTA